MGIAIYQVDAFTDKPFSGNPAAVCVMTEPADEQWMQNVAAEMNLSETAFVHDEDDGFHLRWFTPEVEVDLCGHATLATSHILWETGILSPDKEARYHTKSGLLTARLNAPYIEMDFPSKPVLTDRKKSGDDELIESTMIKGLGITPQFIGKNEFDYLIEVDSEEEVRSLKPDFGILRNLSARGIIVTSSADAEFDFISRFFAPGSGIDEDPVTGSAHCCLGPYWQEKLHKNEFRAYQASSRGGAVGVRVEGERVILSGKAVTVLKGELAGSV